MTTPILARKYKVAVVFEVEARTENAAEANVKAALATSNVSLDWYFIWTDCVPKEQE